MVEIINEQNEIEITLKIKESIIMASQEVFKNHGFKDGQACILISDDKKIKGINAKFRNIDKKTDVLSFPAVANFEIFFNNIDKDKSLPYIGDIILSAKTASEQAIEYGHSIEREFAFLVIHGILHLIGYDHIEKDDEIIMLEKQREILNAINIMR